MKKCNFDKKALLLKENAHCDRANALKRISELGEEELLELFRGSLGMLETSEKMLGAIKELDKKLVFPNAIPDVYQIFFSLIGLFILLPISSGVAITIGIEVGGDLGLIVGILLFLTLVTGMVICATHFYDRRWHRIKEKRNSVLLKWYNFEKNVFHNSCAVRIPEIYRYSRIIQEMIIYIETEEASGESSFWRSCISLWKDDARHKELLNALDNVRRAAEEARVAAEAALAEAEASRKAAEATAADVRSMRHGS